MKWTTKAVVLALQFAPNADSLAAVTWNRFLRWTWPEAVECNEHTLVGWVRAAVSPDLRWSALARSGGQVILWDNQTGIERTNWLAHGNMTLPVTFSPDGRYVASGGFDSKAMIRDIERDRTVKELDVHRATVGAVAFSPNGRLFATASYDQTACVWETETWKEVAQFRGRQSGYWAAAFSADSKTLATGSKDGGVVLWPVVSEKRLPEVLLVDKRGVYMPGSSLVGFVGQDGRNMSLDLAPPFATRQHDPPPGTVGPCFILSQGQAVGLTKDGRLRLGNRHRMEDMATIARFRRLGDPFESPDFSLTALSLSTQKSGESAVLVLDLKRRRVSAELAERFSGYVRAAFSPDQRLLALGTHDGEVLLWDVVDNRIRARWRAHKLRASVAFAEDGRTLATAGEDGFVRLWDVATQQEVGVFRAEADAFWSVTFSPDGRRIVAGTGEHSVVVWDRKSRQQLLTIRGHKSPVVTEVKFTSDGTLIALAEAAVHFWRCVPEDAGK